MDDDLDEHSNSKQSGEYRLPFNPSIRHVKALFFYQEWSIPVVSGALEMFMFSSNFQKC